MPHFTHQRTPNATHVMFIGQLYSTLQRAKSLNIMGQAGHLPPSPEIARRESDAFCLQVFQDVPSPCIPPETAADLQETYTQVTEEVYTGSNKRESTEPRHKSPLGLAQATPLPRKPHLTTGAEHSAISYHN